MSAAGPNASGNLGDYDEQGLRFASVCESMARLLSHKYDEGETDSFVFHTIDNGLEGENITSEVLFAAERIYDKTRSQRASEMLYDAEYSVRGTFSREMLRYADLPVSLQGAMSKHKQLGKKDLQSKAVLYAIGVEAQYTVTHEGEFESERSLTLSVGNEDWCMTGKLAKALQYSGGISAHAVVGSADWARELLDPADVASLADAGALFMDNQFTETDLQLFQELNEEMARLEAAKQPVNMFIAQLALFKQVYKRDPYELATNLVTNLAQTGEAA